MEELKDDNDIVRDILYRVQEFIGPLFFTYRDAEKLELDIKSDWGGDRASISRGRELRLQMRDAKLIKKWDAGATYKELRKEFGLTPKTVRRILVKYNRT